ncbi:hypothetical protein [Actinomycetospora soli]|uniref:hypothetical protein n=1 Tax=Actinomycetospora soli TaxID=2893887 RepID=UPI001E5C9681|nr:hypothetical protein [Actinomycetospora soli]MCD2188787.1 hypothetical protein [Actinomycetospora soli]
MSSTTRLSAVTATAAMALFFLPGSASAAPTQALPSQCAQSGSSVTCTYLAAGGQQTLAIPANATNVRVTVRGGAGGAGGDGGGATAGAAGGNGAVVSGALPTAAGTTLTIRPGVRGADGTDGTAAAGTGGAGSGTGGGGGTGGIGGGAVGGGGGGGAGGASSVVLQGDAAVAVAAGGGGGGGGAGGTNAARVGGAGGAAAANGSAGVGTGTATGGAAGASATQTGATAAAATGERAGGGGGGGGGLRGGDAGATAANTGGGGGGGGTNRVPTGGTVAATNTAAGSVVVTYQGPVVKPASVRGDVRYGVDGRASISLSGSANSGSGTCSFRDGDVRIVCRTITSATSDGAGTATVTGTALTQSGAVVGFTLVVKDGARTGALDSLSLTLGTQASPVTSGVVTRGDLVVG